MSALNLPKEAILILPIFGFQVPIKTFNFYTNTIVK